MYEMLDWIDEQAMQVAVWLINRRSFLITYWIKFCVWVQEPTTKYLKRCFPKPVSVESTEDIQLDEILLYDPNDCK